MTTQTPKYAPGGKRLWCFVCGEYDHADGRVCGKEIGDLRRQNRALYEALKALLQYLDDRTVANYATIGINAPSVAAARAALALVEETK